MGMWFETTIWKSAMAMKSHLVSDMIRCSPRGDSSAVALTASWHGRSRNVAAEFRQTLLLSSAFPTAGVGLHYPSPYVLRAAPP